MKAVVVWGPPASGKSTYVTNSRGDNDVVFDYDILMQTMAGVKPHDHNKPFGKYLWQIRQLLIRNLKYDTKLNTFWCIVTWVDDDFRAYFDGWEDVDYHLMDTTEQECIDRVENNDDRQASKDEQIEVIKDWFKKYDKYYKDKRSTPTKIARHNQNKTKEQRQIKMYIPWRLR